MAASASRLTMTISREIQRTLEREDFDALEADWLSRLDEDPHDVDYAVGVARALSGRQQEERAQVLLQLWDEMLVEGGFWETRLALLRRAGELLADRGALHLEIERNLRALFPDHTRFDELVELVGLHRAVEDSGKLWQKTDRLLAILPFDVGTVVTMAGRGAGRVVDVNVDLQSLRVELEATPSLTVGFRAAEKSLQRLDEAHILRQKLERPEELRRLAEEDPGELLRRVLTSHDRPVTAGEIRQALSGIVPQEAWNAWWNGVRRDPRLLHDAKGRSLYSWGESAAGVESALWARFESAKTEERLGMIRSHAERAPELTERMAGALGVEATSRVEGEPAAALEIALVLERLGRREASGAPDPSALLGEMQEPTTSLLRLDSRALREDAYRLLPRVRGDGVELLGSLLRREPDPHAVATLAAGLAENEPQQLERLMDEILSQPRKAPAAFVWLVDESRQKEAVRSRSPLRLLKQFLQALEWDELKPFRPGLLAELDSGGLVARLIAHLDAAQGRQAAEALKRAPIEEFRRTPLMNALRLRFPELEVRRDSLRYALPASITAKREELRRLEEVEIPRNREAIKAAVELGDLRENFEYKSARQRHEYLSARAAALDEELDRVRPIELADVDPSKVRVGCSVRLVTERGDERKVTILGPWESDPDRNILSHESEIAQALLGHRPGDTVDLPDGAYRIDTVLRAEL